MLKNIPLGINRRLCDISSNKDVFLEAIPPYQAELEKCGYKEKLAWLEEDATHQNKRKRSRSKKVIWFNPPYSMNVNTNVGKEFLLLLDKHFPKNNPLSKFLNRNTVKMSYRCMPNMGRCLAKHNSKILRGEMNPLPRKEANCNCQKSKKGECPIPGACNQDGVVYQASVTTNDGRKEDYVGLAKHFKKRWHKHKATLKDSEADGQTTLSRYVWKKRQEGLDPKIEWRFLEENVQDFNPVTEICKLCTREKFQIVLNPSVASLNLRTEFFSHCRHRDCYLIGDPPD